MQKIIPAAALLMVAAAAFPGAAPARQAHTHHATPPKATSTPAAPDAQPARRWATDAPLREGMGRIRASVDALDHARHGQHDPAKVRTLAAAIRKDVDFLIANCKLDPAADAALHGVIAQLLQHAATLERAPADAAAVDGLKAALADYARTFDEPGFPAAK